MSVIILITDFGTLDEYVGVLKGVILSIHPNSKIVDSYNNVDKFSPLYIIGSRNMLEVTVNCGSARDYFNLKRSDQVFIKVST